jgi:hypothetical protein
MQIRARSEANRILRVLRLGCALMGMATRKILAHPVWQQKAEKSAEKRSSGKETLTVEILRPYLSDGLTTTAPFGLEVRRNGK